MYVASNKGPDVQNLQNSLDFLVANHVTAQNATCKPAPNWLQNNLRNIPSVLRIR